MIDLRLASHFAGSPFNFEYRYIQGHGVVKAIYAFPIPGPAAFNSKL